MKVSLKKGLAAGVVAALLASAGAAFAGEVSYVHAGRVLADPATGRVAERQTLVIEDGKVKEIRDGFVGEGSVVDLSSKFVLPGFIDSHVHLSSQQGDGYRASRYTNTSADAALNAAYYARITLEAGFTTVADLGGPGESAVALRRSIQQGRTAGPRILAATGMVTPHGGHGDANGVAEQFVPILRSTAVCSGPDDCRRAVRERVRNGADIIKISATGGVLSDTGAGLNQQFSDDELKAIVETAHFMGRQVTAHAHGTDGIASFLRAGGDSIEHGTFIDEEGIRLLKQNGRYLVPTLLAGDFVAREAVRPGNQFTPFQRQKSLEAGPLMLDMARRAHRAGVKIAFGTDNGVAPHGTNAREFQLLVEAGLTPLQAIQAATINAADHFRLGNEIGRITAGYSADIIAVDGNPLEDVTTLMDVDFVMRAGNVYKNK